MPTRTLYLNDNDLKIYEQFKRAVKPRDISPLFTSFMRQHLGKLDAENDGFTEVSVKVGSPGPEREKHFMGKRLFATWRGFGSTGASKAYEFYKTPKDNYVIVVSSLPDLSIIHLGTNDLSQQAVVSEDHPERLDAFMADALKWAEGDFDNYPYDREVIVITEFLDIYKCIPQDIAKRFADKLAFLSQSVEYLDV